jgi:predicted ArsR family transcriptional regulator
VPTCAYKCRVCGHEVTRRQAMSKALTQPGSIVTDAALLAMLHRRPWTARAMASQLGLHVAEVTKRLHVLTGVGAVTPLRRASVLLYTAADRTPRDRSSGIGRGRGRA